MATQSTWIFILFIYLFIYLFIASLIFIYLFIYLFLLLIFMYLLFISSSSFLCVLFFCHLFIYLWFSLCIYVCMHACMHLFIYFYLFIFQRIELRWRNEKMTAWTPCKQEAHLMLTNPRDAFRCQSRSPNSIIPYVRYSFLLCNSKCEGLCFGVLVVLMLLLTR